MSEPSSKDTVLKTPMIYVCGGKNFDIFFLLLLTISIPVAASHGHHRSMFRTCGSFKGMNEEYPNSFSSIEKSI